MDEFGWLADYLLEVSNSFSEPFREFGLARLDYKAHESWETFGKTWGFFFFVFVSFSVRDTTMFIVMGGKGGRRNDYLLLLPIRTKQRG